MGRQTWAAAAATLLLAAGLGGCVALEEPGWGFKVDNDTGLDIEVVHVANDGREEPTRPETRIGPGGHVVYLPDDLCDSGTLVARTADGHVELARRASSAMQRVICYDWQVGPPPSPATPAASPAP